MFHPFNNSIALRFTNYNKKILFLLGPFHTSDNDKVCNCPAFGGCGVKDGFFLVLGEPDINHLFGQFLFHGNSIANRFTSMQVLNKNSSDP